MATAMSRRPYETTVLPYLIQVTSPARFHRISSHIMSNTRNETSLGQEALTTFPAAWRTMYVVVFIVLSVVFGALAAIEFNDRNQWIEAPFSTLTQVVIGAGSASGLVSLFVTETVRAIMLFSTWLEKKLNENLEKSRARIREEGRVGALSEGRHEGRLEGYEEGRKAGLLEARGKRPPPPPWDRNGSNGNGASDDY